MTYLWPALALAVGVILGEIRADQRLADDRASVAAEVRKANEMLVAMRRGCWMGWRAKPPMVPMNFTEE